MQSPGSIDGNTKKKLRERFKPMAAFQFMLVITNMLSTYHVAFPACLMMMEFHY